MRIAEQLSWIVGALAVFASLVPLAAPGVYRDNVLVASGWLGNDIVTLVVVVPALMVAVARARHGATRPTLVWFGLLAYMVYNYAFYLFGAAFNSLFLVYTALFTLSAFGLAFGLANADVPEMARHVRYVPVVRGVALYLLLVAFVLGGFWVSTSLEYVFTGRVPSVVAAVGHPTNVIAALDLSMVVSVALVAGHLLWRRQAWGLVLATIWSVKGTAYMLALSAASVSAFGRGAASDVAQLGLWVPIGAGCALAAWVLLRAIGASRAGGSEPGGTRSSGRSQEIRGGFSTGSSGRSGRESTERSSPHVGNVRPAGRPAPVDHVTQRTASAGGISPDRHAASVPRWRVGPERYLLQAPAAAAELGDTPAILITGGLGAVSLTSLTSLLDLPKTPCRPGPARRARTRPARQCGREMRMGDEPPEH